MIGSTWSGTLLQTTGVLVYYQQRQRSYELRARHPRQERVFARVDLARNVVGEKQK